VRKHPVARGPKDHTSHDPARLSISATLHCLTGCAIGEVLGMVNLVGALALLGFVFGAVVPAPRPSASHHEPHPGLAPSRASGAHCATRPSRPGRECISAVWRKVVAVAGLGVERSAAPGITQRG
jgi:hypothetical protein